MSEPNESHVGAERQPAEEGPFSPREQEANRAFRCAIVGLIFWPMQLWTGLLLMCVVFAKERLEGKPRRRAKIAGGIFLCFALGFPALIVYGIFYQPSPESYLLRLPRPGQLVGSWSGKGTDKEGDFKVDMELRRNGKIVYREPEPPAVECHGSWGYEMPQLLFYFRMAKGAPASWVDRTMSWDVERCTDSELRLRGGDMILRLSRQN